MHLLDRPSFAAGDPDGRELLAPAISIYEASESAKPVVKESGVPVSSIFWNRPMADVWPGALEAAAKGRRLRRLVDLMARDNSGWEIFRRLRDLTGTCVVTRLTLY
jgi:Effector-associated domain 1